VETIVVANREAGNRGLAGVTLGTEGVRLASAEVGGNQDVEVGEVSRWGCRFVEWSLGRQSVSHEHLAVPPLDVVKWVVPVLAHDADAAPHRGIEALHASIERGLAAFAHITELRVREGGKNTLLDLGHDCNDLRNSVRLALDQKKSAG
jgi:hypothetical protein